MTPEERGLQYLLKQVEHVAKTAPRSLLQHHHILLVEDDMADPDFTTVFGCDDHLIVVIHPRALPYLQRNIAVEKGELLSGDALARAIVEDLISKDPNLESKLRND
jgi:hypothetical protein